MNKPKKSSPKKATPKVLKPGQSSGENGGVFQEYGPRGGKRSSFATIADNKVAPPTTKPNSTWKLIMRTPDSKRE